MAAIGSVLSAAQLAGGIVASQVERRQSRKEQNLAVRQLQQQQELQASQAQANADLERRSIALDTANAEEQRKSALKRAVARQRANFAGQGVGAGGGSSQAVLLGLFDESEDEMERRTSLDNMRLSALDEGLSQRNALNVLQRTQLQERSRVGNLARDIKLGRDWIDMGDKIFNGKKAIIEN